MRNLFALFALFACLTVTAVPAAEPPFAAYIRYANTAGSGTVVDFQDGKSLVVTVKHFQFRAGDKVRVRANGQETTGVVLAVARDADLSVIVADGELPAAYIADKEPDPNTPVRQWGTPWHANTRHVFKHGLWRGGWDGHGRETMRLEATTIQSESGDSGSGVFDAAGKLVGICVGMSQGHEVITPLAQIRPFLARWGFRR